MKRRRYTYRPTKPFEEFTRKRFSNGEEILVISREPNRPFSSRFQPSQLIQTLKKLVDIRNSTIETADFPCSVGAGNVAAFFTEVCDADENGV
jgi:hypothetical protein